MLRHVALVRTDVSEELSASFIRVTRIGELGTTLGVTSTDKRWWQDICTEILWPDEPLPSVQHKMLPSRGSHHIESQALQ
jgi:hypothetical protein